MTNSLRLNIPLLVVVALSVVIGFLMVLVFRYTSDQKAIRHAKDRLKAHMLAVRLFQDQLAVVLKSYWSILGGTGRYLRLAFRPLLFVSIPLILFIIQMDRYLGLTPMPAGQPFLLTVRSDNTDLLSDISLQLPRELTTTAPAVHIPASNEVVWRIVPQREGEYGATVAAGGRAFSKQVIVSSRLPRLSTARLRGQFWRRMFFSSESALPDDSPIQSIEVNYAERNIHFAWLDWNWIWLFFVLSLAAGFFFKSILGIEI